MTNKRPLDFLNDRIGMRVHVAIKSPPNEARGCTGTLVAFDLHLNVWLDDTCTATKSNAGPLLIRGDMVVSIGDANG